MVFEDQRRMRRNPNWPAPMEEPSKMKGRCPVALLYCCWICREDKQLDYHKIMFSCLYHPIYPSGARPHMRTETATHLVKEGSSSSWKRCSWTHFVLQLSVRYTIVWMRSWISNCPVKAWKPGLFWTTNDEKNQSSQETCSILDSMEERVSWPHSLRQILKCFRAIITWRIWFWLAAPVRPSTHTVPPHPPPVIFAPKRDVPFV